MRYRSIVITGIEVGSILEEINIRISALLKAAAIESGKILPMACEPILGIVSKSDYEGKVANQAEEVWSKASGEPAGPPPNQPPPPTDPLNVDLLSSS